MVVSMMARLLTARIMLLALAPLACAMPASAQLHVSETPPGEADPFQEIEELRTRVLALEQLVAEQPPTPAGGCGDDLFVGCGDACAPPPCDCSKCAGYDNGFYIKSLDGDFSLKVRGLLQMRHVADWRNTTLPTEDPNEAGFVVERAPILFLGNFFGPQWQYWFILQGSRVDNHNFVEEAKVMYTFENGALAQVGRFRNPAFLRELDLSYTRQLGVERSYFNSVFTTGVVEGVTLSNQHDCLRWITCVSDGRNSGSSAVSSDFYQDNADFAISAAVDVKLFGEWAQYGDFASWPDEEPALFLGAAVHSEKGEHGDDLAVNNLNDFWSYTFDLTYENHGFMMFGAVVGRESRATGTPINQSGALFMTSYQLVPEKLEPFFRYEYIDFDGFTNVGANGAPVLDSSLNILSAGFNWYFHRHGLKITTEVMHALDAVPFSAGNTGFLADQPGQSGQTVLRNQLQLFF